METGSALSPVCNRHKVGGDLRVWHTPGRKLKPFSHPNEPSLSSSRCAGGLGRTSGEGGKKRHPPGRPSREALPLPHPLAAGMATRNATFTESQWQGVSWANPSLLASPMFRSRGACSGDRMEQRFHLASLVPLVESFLLLRCISWTPRTGSLQRRQPRSSHTVTRRAQRLGRSRRPQS